MTPDEKVSGPDRLRWYIQVMVEVGERDPSKIARAAIGMLREYEQDPALAGARRRCHSLGESRLTAARPVPAADDGGPVEAQAANIASFIFQRVDRGY